MAACSMTSLYLLYSVSYAAFCVVLCRPAISCLVLFRESVHDTAPAMARLNVWLIDIVPVYASVSGVRRCCYSRCLCGSISLQYFTVQ